MGTLFSFVLVVLITLVSSFIVTFFIMPSLIRTMKLRGITGTDMNKFNKPKVPESGGIGVLFGFLFGIMASIFAFSYLHIIELNLSVLLAGFSTIVFIGLIGILDDLILLRKQGIAQWQHALIPIVAALPLMAIKINNTPFKIPFFGTLPSEFLVPFFGVVSFGVFYSLVLVPIGVTGASNATNMLAGFNGLEAGLGILMSFTLLVISILWGNVEAAVLIAAILGALLAFIWFNWFPAKIFGGDALTLMIGAAIAATVIIGDMEKIGVLLMSLFFIELLFKAKHKFQSQCFGIPTKNGFLKANPKGGSLTHWVMRKGKFTEKQVTLIILGMQSVVCVIVFLMFYFKLFN